jgi:ACT domain-containing protein
MDKKKQADRAVVTVVGKDKAGIVMAITTALAKEGVNIEDITQTVMDDLFAMIMLVDLQDTKKSITEIQKKLDVVGKRTGQHVQIQHEKIFQAMHRI